MQNCCHLLRIITSQPRGYLSRAFVALSLLIAASSSVRGGVLFHDDFNFTGWTVVQPPATYADGPLRWDFDPSLGAIIEQSNIYTDSATFSPSAIAPMLINNTVSGASFTYNARLTTGDDDGFGLIFGYQNPTNFYRVTFARQNRTGGYPWQAWVVERNLNGTVTRLHGYGTPGYSLSFMNAANVPFDVRINVDALNRLTLTITNNPTGTPTPYTLVNAQLLPVSADGRVGLCTWGMGSLGGTFAGWRAQNLSMSPNQLAGTQGTQPAWISVVPPRMVGNDPTVSGTPLWAMSTGINGNTGLLSETGNCYAGNDGPGNVDFTGATLVTGSTTWSNYVAAARIIPGDDDGHGLVFRYANTANFYRVVLRSETVTTNGPPRGLSIQKNVNQVYTEVYRDNATQYVPVNGQPYDLLAQIATNTLTVTVVADPLGTAQVFNYGPFPISGVNTGAAGLISWGMARTDVDWFSVHDGASLYVTTPHGTPTPVRGLTSYPPGTLVDASVSGVITQPGVRAAPTGWIGTGSVPPSGTGTNVSFNINEFSRLQWLWNTEYQLAVTNTPGGTVIYPPGDWFAAGSNVTLTAVPTGNNAFLGWTGDVQSSSPTLILTMDQPYSVVANFSVDTDGDGLPDSWEMAWFNDLDEVANGDPDGDGKSNAQELAANTNPKVADILRIEKLQFAGANAILTVSNNTGTRFNVQRAISLPSNWANISTEPLGGTNVVASALTYTSSVPVSTQGFWRLSQPGPQSDVPPFVPGSWSLAVLPDTQNYSQSYPELFKDQTRWIVANKDRFNIKYVLHLGDIVNLSYTTQQWINAKAAISLLDGQIPYALAPGNHDFGGEGANRNTIVNNFFPVSLYTNWPSFGGTYQPNRIENSYHLFSAGGVDWIVFAMEWGPRNGSTAWASSIASNYPSRKKIMITHAYMYSDETRYDWATKNSAQSWNPHSYGIQSDPDGVNDGEELWNKFVKLHPNFVMTLNGHVLNDGLARLSTTNIFGEMVHQMLVNYQMKPLGGEAYLRIIEFRPDGKTAQVKAYSPYYGTYKTDPANQFQITFQPPLY